MKKYKATPKGEITEDIIYELTFLKDWRVIKNSHGKISFVKELMNKMLSESFEIYGNDLYENDDSYSLNVKGYFFEYERFSFENLFNVVEVK